ncbi:Hint domain-containing protein [Acetobacter senegalensis]|uniref:Hint domain-containing protein n=1 Tax=Acetobacter senegalensis TaxID=446692 RepID=UPI001EDA2ED7|nr:Hint domain-containing protein [Acetobacter senegalensis]MCG4256211.1 Hint domain-containing protein [Acetobacter senegalensis]MCG4266231.1 Hint domain-containing protein [Acetobacter senegalensis]
MSEATDQENTVTIVSDVTGKTTTTHHGLDAFNTVSSTRTIVTSNGLTYTVTTNQYTGLVSGAVYGTSYDVKITDSSGTSLLNQTNINRGINVLNIIQIGASGDVIAGSSDSAVLINLASIGTYVSLPGSTGDFTVGVGGLTANTYYIGGDTSIDGLANLLTGTTVNVVGGTATLTGTGGSALVGALNGSTVNIEYGGTLNTGAALASVLEGSTVNFGTGGGTVIINGGGTLISLLASGSLNATTFNNYDPSKDTIELQNTTNPIATYTIENGGLFGLDSSQKVIVLKDSSGKTVAEYAVKPADGVVLNNATYNVNDVTNNPLKVTYSNGNTYIGACFLAGSMILTSEGEVAVEDIQIGDEIIAFDWRNKKDVTRSVVWVGKAHVNVRHGLPDDEAGWPVRVLKDAIADGVPYKDMLITSEHCLFFKDRFVPVRMLVNGVSIFYDKSISSYDYYHVETEQHSVITADGMLTESYLDTGNRSSFRQEGKIATLRGAVKSWVDDAGAPLGVERSFVEPLFRALEWREDKVSVKQAPADLELTSDPDLHLVTDTGAVVRPMRKTAHEYSFMLPPSTQSVRIVSRASRPSDVIGPFVDDRRYMGVAVGEVRLFCAKQQFDITSHLTAEKPAGWHADMGWDGVAWTSGNAELPLGDHLSNGKMGILSITVRAAGPYIKDSQAMTKSVKSA